jgi:hypothetical protein
MVELEIEIQDGVTVLISRRYESLSFTMTIYSNEILKDRSANYSSIPQPHRIVSRPSGPQYASR